MAGTAPVTETKINEKRDAIRETLDEPKSLAIFSAGILTSRDFAKGMSCLMSDLIGGRITPQVGNAVVNAGGKLLKVVEMQQRYGTQTTQSGAKVLQLADEK